MTDRYGVIVVGGGASGVLSAAHLAARSGPPVAVVATGATWGQGVAYGTTDNGHLLNTPAEVMSAHHNDPTHFVTWLRSTTSLNSEGAQITADTFAPRATYAHYLGSVIDDMTGPASERVVRRVAARAMRLRIPAGPGGVHAAGGVQVTLDDGRVLMADHAVLALGHGAPADLPAMESVVGSPRYISDPWSSGTLDAVAKHRPILLIGSGLTAVDVVVTLLRRGHMGPLTMLSRHGLLPTAHPDPRQPAHTAELDTRTAGAAARSLRAAIRKLTDSPAASTPIGWQAVFDGLRPNTDLLWSRLSLAEQRRFLRHLFRYWEIHRHRMAPAIGRLIERARNSGRLTVLGATLHGATFNTEATGAGDIDVEFTHRGGTATVRKRYGHVINCTGPTSALRTPQPLLAGALRDGLVRVDPLGLGLDTDDRGVPHTAVGAVEERLSIVGPLRRNHRCWESTAIPELRAQAAAMAALVDTRLVS